MKVGVKLEMEACGFCLVRFGGCRDLHHAHIWALKEMGTVTSGIRHFHHAGVDALSVWGWSHDV
jgi:hypothetical protein